MLSPTSSKVPIDPPRKKWQKSSAFGNGGTFLVLRLLTLVLSWLRNNERNRSFCVCSLCFLLLPSSAFNSSRNFSHHVRYPQKFQRDANRLGSNCPELLEMLRWKETMRLSEKQAQWNGKVTYPGEALEKQYFTSQFSGHYAVDLRPYPTQRPIPPMWYLQLHKILETLGTGNGYAVSVGGFDPETQSMVTMKGLNWGGNPWEKNKCGGQEQLGRVSPSIFAQALTSKHVPKDFDVLKLDLDSFECDLLQIVLEQGFRPKVIVVELNPAWPPPLRFHMHYHPEYKYDTGGTFFYGCSLQVAADILSSEYKLLQYTWVDGWFVHADLYQPFVFRGSNPSENPVEAYRLGNPEFYIRVDHRWGARDAQKLFERTSQAGLSESDIHSIEQELLAKIRKEHSELERMVNYTLGRKPKSTGS
eukprot:g25703.t1